MTDFEQEIRRHIAAAGPDRGGRLLTITIDYIGGFELFNTNAYHNYETWSQGFRIEDKEGNVAEAEHLNEAWERYLECTDTSSTS